VMPFAPKDRNMELEEMCSGNPTDVSWVKDTSLARRFEKPRLELVNELILDWLVEEGRSCKLENIDPDVELPEVIPKRGGKLSGWRRWAILSDNLSPPQASGGVMEESSLLEDGVGVEPPSDVKDWVSSCAKNDKKHHGTSMKILNT
jgi:hypothetical protein